MLSWSLLLPPPLSRYSPAVKGGVQNELKHASDCANRHGIACRMSSTFPAPAWKVVCWPREVYRTEWPQSVECSTRLRRQKGFICGGECLAQQALSRAHPSLEFMAPLYVTVGDHGVQHRLRAGDATETWILSQRTNFSVAFVHIQEVLQAVLLAGAQALEKVLCRR